MSDRPSQVTLFQRLQVLRIGYLVRYPNKLPTPSSSTATCKYPLVMLRTCFDWLFNWRRLRVRYEKRDDIHEAFLIIGCCMICWNRVLKFC